MDTFDIYPQKFYLLSTKRRTLIDFSSADHEFATAVDQAFDKMKCILGGNIHAVYQFEPEVLDIMQSLSDSYKKRYPYVQQLPKYFKGFESGDYFIRQKSSVSLLDMKRAVLETESRTLGIDVKKADNYFVTHWGRLFVTFDTYSYGFLTDKVYIGEADKNKRVCRFCKGTGIDRYKNVSHALQEGLGNHLLFAYEECDACNSRFSNDIETPLFRFLEINRNLSRVKGKGSSLHNQEGMNFHIHPDPLTKEHVVYIKQEYVANVSCKGQTMGKIILYNKAPVTFQGIYKALLKFAVDMIPSDRKRHFVKTGEWVHGDFDCSVLPPFSYGEHSLFFEQPVLDLFFRNEHSPINSPYCTAVLYIFDSVFIYTVPFNDVDGNRYMTVKEVTSHLKLFKDQEYLDVQEWVEYDSNDTNKRAAQYKIPALGVEGKYRVEYRPSTDKVFRIERGRK